MPLASFGISSGRVEPYLVADLEDRFSRDVAHMMIVFKILITGKDTSQMLFCVKILLIMQYDKKFGR